jgi:DNA repair exonuclease SbcCD ATPase subunit
MGTGTGAAIGAGAGAIIGGIVGLVQEAKDRKEQDRLAQERAYQQDLAKKRSEEARRKAEIDEELAVAQGFRISEIELNEAQKKLDAVKAKQKALEDEKAAAKARKLALDDAKSKTLEGEAKIAQLEEEIARLKGEEAPKNASATGDKKADAGAAPPPSAAVKPGN